MGFGVWGSGFRVWGLGFRVQGLGARSLRFRDGQDGQLYPTTVLYEVLSVLWGGLWDCKAYSSPSWELEVEGLGFKGVGFRV